MRERVLRAVEALGYVPNAAARSLSMALSHTIGVVVPDLHGEFFSELIRGMDIGASASGYQLLLSTMHADIQLAGQALRAMHGRVDGLIVMAPQIDPEELDTLLPPRLPVVLLICSEGRGRPLLQIDNREGAGEAARYLLSLGRKRIVHIAGPSANFEAAERREGFEETMAKLAPLAQSISRTGDFGEESGAAAIRDVLDKGETFDAVFAANDMMALGAMQELRQRKIDIPKEVAIVGFDDIPLARFMGLTTMQVHMAELGERAVRSLASLLNGTGEAESVRLAPKLVVRSSARATA